MTLGDGKERAISLFWADGQLVVTSVTKGDESSVRTNDSISVRYVPHPTRKGYYRKEVVVNGSTVKRLDIYKESVPKSVEVEYLFNMHTHPKAIDGSFSFFSLQDVRSLIGSKVVVTGLVEGKLWLLVRTSESPSSVLWESDADITLESLKEDFRFGVYVAEFSGNAVKQ